MTWLCAEGQFISRSIVRTCSSASNQGILPDDRCYWKGRRLPISKLSPWHIAVGDRLRAARKAKGLTIRQVADHIGCSYQMYQRYETATARLPADALVRVAAMFGVTPSSLLPETRKGLTKAGTQT
ncbi:helix-turn-helix domain-containing protein [Hyphomicrobium sp. 2TAF46]|uniref:helix-turn-helix domain-containing protein n=1 Tax=Hyphomicrobium sp. 2TAF46 TaxID=3233019 RepID=UPI003F8F6DC8